MATPTLKSCGVNTTRFLKYVWPFYNIMHERVNSNYLLRNEKTSIVNLNVYKRSTVCNCLHSMKNVQIRNFFWSVIGHFSRSVKYSEPHNPLFMPIAD